MHYHLQYQGWWKDKYEQQIGANLFTLIKSHISLAGHSIECRLDNFLYKESAIYCIKYLRR